MYMCACSIELCKPVSVKTPVRQSCVHYRASTYIHTHSPIPRCTVLKIQQLQWKSLQLSGRPFLPQSDPRHM